MQSGRSGYGRVTHARIFAIALVALGAPLVACGSPPAAKPVTARASFAWETTIGARHPLIGVFYDPALGHEVSREAFLERIHAARYVFLGEKHDNPDHHRLEAAALAEVAEDRPVAMVLEMIPNDKQAALDQLFVTKKNDVHAADIGVAVDWDKSGWPAFTQYQPLFEVAVGSRVALVGGDLSRSDAHAITHGGAEAIHPDIATDFHLSTPLPPDDEAAFEKEIADVHCGMLPPAFVPKMVLAQRARDATLAKAVLEQAALQAGNAPKYASIVLVSGAGHARTDRGAPKLLQERGAPAAQMLSVGMLEVDDARPNATDYASGFHATKLPFDLVWFTPRASDDDPCAQMKAPSPGK